MTFADEATGGYSLTFLGSKIRVSVGTHVVTYFYGCLECQRRKFLCRYCGSEVCY